jgi:hypothetical protein
MVNLPAGSGAIRIDGRFAGAGDDETEHLLLRGVPDIAVADILAALENHDAIADLENVLQPMRDYDLGDAITERFAVGSSRMTTRGSKEMARAIATDC